MFFHPGYLRRYIALHSSLTEIDYQHAVFGEFVSFFFSSFSWRIEEANNFHHLILLSAMCNCDFKSLGLEIVARGNFFSLSFTSAKRLIGKWSLLSSWFPLAKVRHFPGMFLDFAEACGLWKNFLYFESAPSFPLCPIFYRESSRSLSP